MNEIDPRVLSAVDHLQKAALEMIAAMRNALDVAEDLVGDPTAIATLLQGAAIAARSVVATVAPVDAEAPEEAHERVTRIRVD
jgi:hypothetical protein